MFEWIKAHPGLTIGGVVVAIIVIVLVRGGSSGGEVQTAGGPTDAQVQGATALQLKQIDANQYGAGLQASLIASQDKNSTDIATADMWGKLQYNLATIAQDVAKYQIGQQAQVTSLQSTLVAQTQQFDIQSRVDTAAINANQNVAIAQTTADTLRSIADSQASVARANIAAAAQIATTDRRGIFSKIFG